MRKYIIAAKCAWQRFWWVVDHERMHERFLAISKSRITEAVARKHGINVIYFDEIDVDVNDLRGLPFNTEE